MRIYESNKSEYGSTPSLKLEVFETSSDSCRAVGGVMFRAWMLLMTVFMSIAAGCRALGSLGGTVYASFAEAQPVGSQKNVGPNLTRLISAVAIALHVLWLARPNAADHESSYGIYYEHSMHNEASISLDLMNERVVIRYFSPNKNEYINLGVTYDELGFDEVWLINDSHDNKIRLSDELREAKLKGYHDWGDWKDYVGEQSAIVALAVVDVLGGTGTAIASGVAGTGVGAGIGAAAGAVAGATVGTVGGFIAGYTTVDGWIHFGNYPLARPFSVP